VAAFEGCHLTHLTRIGGQVMCINKWVSQLLRRGNEAGTAIRFAANVGRPADASTPT
jgi:hypothetical protein